MLAFGIQYLNGFVAAVEPGGDGRAEWPPHPGRVFMALAAAHFQTGCDPGERRALLWLEALGQAPAIAAGDCLERAQVTHFVPVNDKVNDKDKKKVATMLLQSAPVARGRQPRAFARATLDNDTAYFVWFSAAPSDADRRALADLCGKVTRVGHSTSLVQMWVAQPDEVGEPNWVPANERAERHLRIAGPGTLEDLACRYNGAVVDQYFDLQLTVTNATDKNAQKAAKMLLKDRFPDGQPSRLRPQLSLYQGYARAVSADDPRAARGTVFSPNAAVLTLAHETGPYRHLDLACVLAVTQLWREAVISQSNDLPIELRELLSGHARDGRPLELPHLAFLPLAFVGQPHADGHLLGWALALPTGLTPANRRLALAAIGQVRRLTLGRLGTWTVAPQSLARPPSTLRMETWTAGPEGAARWSTVSPVVLDRHPKSKERASYEREVVATIAASCARIGLPEPRHVIVTPIAAHMGVPPAHAFPRLRRKDNSERRHTHVILDFGQRVRGPIVLGAGRYRGYGFLRPLRDQTQGMP